jgi:hypothetical protein
MRMIFRSVILFLFMMILPGIVNSQQKNDLLSRIKVQLLFYRTQNVNQTVIIQTDKSLYRPDETIWINGFVTEASTYQLSAKSKELIVQLIDNKGRVISSVNFPLKDGTASGSLSIPSDTGSDLYMLIAWTPEMAEGSFYQPAMKDIYIGSPENFDLVPKINYANTVFPHGEKGTAVLKLNDYSGKPISGEKFEYRVTSSGKELTSGKGKTTADGSAEFTFTTSAEVTGKAMMANVSIPAGNEKINLVSHIPRSDEKIDVSFFPEGGKIIPGIPQRVVFRAKDQLGNPVEVNANIVDLNGEILARTSSIQKGLGLINMINPENSGYKFIIQSDQGKGQTFQLPQADTTGMCISVVRSDGQNMDLLLARSPKSKHSKFLVFTLNNGEINWASEFELEQSGRLKIPLDNFESEIGGVVVFNSNGTLAGERLIFTGRGSQVNVTAEPDKSFYHGGGDGNVKVNLKRPDGTLLKGLLSVSLSDKFANPGLSDIRKDFNYGLERPMISDVPLIEADKTALDCNLIANELKGFDWNKILSIDPSNPKPLNSAGYRRSGIAVDNNKNPVLNAIITRINEWKFLEDLQKSGYFKENPDFLKVNSSGKSKAVDNKAKTPFWKKYLENSNNLRDVIKMIKPFESINGKLVYRGANSFSNQDGALIVIDGQKMGTDAEILNQINPNTVEDLQISVDPTEITKYTSFNSIGVIEIKTKRGQPTVNSAIKSENQKDNVAGTFSPAPIGNKKYNLLTTLQWIPNLWTNESGETMIRFTAGNIKSTFTLNIIGRTEKGEWFEKQMEISVR